MHLLFVCTGNICRSPTAERLAAATAARIGIAEFSAASAGTRAVIGHPVHPDAAVVLRELGGDPAGFAARQLNQRIASSADLILTMTRAHRDSVLEIAPNKLHRTFTLSEAALLATEKGARTFADLAALRSHISSVDVVDVLDPIGQGRDVFAQVGAEIASLLPPVMDLCAAEPTAADK